MNSMEFHPSDLTVWAHYHVDYDYDNTISCGFRGKISKPTSSEEKSIPDFLQASTLAIQNFPSKSLPVRSLDRTGKS